MSVSDAGEPQASSEANRFLEVVREGRSFSGRERHCCFMNLGSGQFANVSSVSGFDLPDDGRGLALVDWDHDGDLDAWVANRNGPQIRFLLNQQPPDRHSLVLQLQGTSSNRDAIGARVQVELEEAVPRPLIRTVRAGDGFLSQSSKRLHFGLGNSSQVRRVVVTWPSGEQQELQLDAVDCLYQITEGESEARVVLPPRPGTEFVWSQEIQHHQAPHRHPQEDPGTPRDALIFSMVHLPAQDYLDLNGIRQPLLDPPSRLLLVNLWASWCAPCLQELSALAAEQNELAAQQISVLALSVDDASRPNGLPTSDAEFTNVDADELNADRKLAERLGTPFRFGRADAPLLDKLQLLHDTLFELHTPLPLPTSFLLDRSGHVVAIYKGPVSVAQLTTDARRLSAKTTEEWRMASLPFPGTWLMPPRRRHLFDMVSQLADRGYLEECQRFVERESKMLMSHPQWPTLARKLQQLAAQSKRDVSLPTPPDSR